MRIKKEFTTPNGSQGMKIGCDKYEVEIFKSDDYSVGITYTNKKTGDSVHIPGRFLIDWDKEEDGGKLEIKFRDRWGCEMIFVHFDPTPIKGMFDFIAKGYGVYKKLQIQ